MSCAWPPSAAGTPGVARRAASEIAGNEVVPSMHPAEMTAEQTACWSAMADGLSRIVNRADGVAAEEPLGRGVRPDTMDETVVDIRGAVEVVDAHASRGSGSLSERVEEAM